MPGFKTFIRNHTVVFGTITVLIALGAIGVAWLVLGQSTTARQNQTPSTAARYNVQSVKLKATELTPQELSSVQSLSINGQLNVNNSIVLSPINQPTRPLKGQLYFDNGRNSLTYYDGSTFNSVADDQTQARQDDRIATLEQQLSDVRGNLPVQPADAALLGANNTFSGTNLFSGSLTAQGLRVSGASVLGATTISSLALSTPLPVTSGGTGTNSLTSNGVVIGNGISGLGTVSSSGADLCLISTTGAPEFKPCPGGVGSGVNSVNNLYGSLIVANATASGATITINDASTSTKGIAQFNSANFSVTNGVVNTVQNISPTAAPSFAGLSVGGPLALSTICTPGQVLTTNGAGTVACTTDDTGTDTNTTYASGNGITISGASNVISVNPQTGGGLSFTAGQLGLTACSIGQILKYTGAAWGCAADSDTVSPGDGVGVTAIGSLDGQSKNAKGGTIYTNGSVLTIALQSADALNPGLVTTSAQSFGGAKTFTNDVALQGTVTQSGTGTFATGTGAVSLNGNVTIASGRSLTLGAACATGQVLTTTVAGTLTCINDDTGTDTNTIYTAGNGISISGASNTIAINPQTNGGLSFVSGQVGLTSCTTGQILKYNGSGWACAADADSVSPGDGVGVTAVGSLDSQTKNLNGATIYNNGGTLSIALQSADSASVGIVTTGAQTLSGAKTFSSAMTLQSNLTQTGAAALSTGSGAVALNGNVAIANGRSLTLGAACGTGQVLSTNTSGVVTCVTDDTGVDTNTTYAAGNGISITGASNTIAVNPQTGGGLSFTAGQLGLLSCTTGQIIKYNGTAWACAADSDTVSPGDGVGVTAVGALDGQARNATGATIYNNGGTLTIALQSANGTSPGLVTTGAQTFGGIKTFANDIALQGGFSQSGSGSLSTGTGAVALNGAVTIASGKSLTLGAACTTGQVLSTTAGGAITCVTDNTGTPTTYTAGNGISISGSSNTIAVNPQTNGGLAFSSGQLGLVSCTTDQVLKYNGTAWVCAADAGAAVAAGAGTNGTMAKFNASGQLANSGLTESGTTLSYSGAVVTNTASGFSGNLLDLQVNGASQLRVSSAGAVTANGLTAFNATGTNSVGGSLDIRAGSGTGSAGSGYISFSTAAGLTANSPYKDLSPTGTYFKNATTANNGSFSQTVSAGANQVLLVAITASSTGAPATSVTYAGQSLTRLSFVDQSNANTRSELWYLLNPPIGTSTVSMTFGAYRTFIARAMTLNDVNQTTPFGTPCTATAFSPTASCTTATTGTDTVLDLMSSGSQFSSLGAGQTSIYAQDELASGGRYSSAGYRQANGASTINSYSFSGNANWAMISVPIHTNYDSNASSTMQERLRITNAGNVGVSNLNPQYALDVTGDANTSGNLRTGGVVRITGSGDATFASLNVSGATTLNTLTVASLSVTGNVIVTGNITVNGHIVTAGAQPTVQIQTAAGSGTVSVSGTDTMGTIIVTTGSAPAAGDLARLVFNQAYGATPRVVMSPSNEAASDLSYYKGAITTTGVMLSTKAVPAANTTYSFDYYIAQ